MSEIWRQWHCRRILRLTHCSSLLQVVINERCVKAVSITNSGATPMDFSWNIGANTRLSVTPEAGTVARGGRCMCELAYHPHTPDRLDGYKVSLQVVNGNK
jgi:hydrocephalus-inducing protein